MFYTYVDEAKKFNDNQIRKDAKTDISSYYIDLSKRKDVDTDHSKRLTFQMISLLSSQF